MERNPVLCSTENVGNNLKVAVYCNIKTRTLSIKALQGELKGLVVAKAEKIDMRNVRYRVSAAGRQRVTDQQRKNVHAFVVGEVDAIWGATLRDDIDNDTVLALGVNRPFLPCVGGRRVSYNPYENSTFVTTSKSPVQTAERVRLDGCRMWAKGINKPLEGEVRGEMLGDRGSAESGARQANCIAA